MPITPKPLIGRNVRIEVAKTVGAAKVVTEITNAKPAVASSAAHGLANGSVAFLDDVVGMAPINGQAIRVANTAAGTFELEGIDATSYPDFTSGNVFPVTAWSTLSRSASYTIGGGAADEIDDTTLLDNMKQSTAGMLAAQSVKIDLKHQTVDEEALGLISDAALVNGYLVFRITLADGAQRLFRGQPSLPDENTSIGSVATGSFNVMVKGRVLRLA